MKKSKLQLKSVAAIAACLFFATTFTTCESEKDDFIFTDDIFFEQEVTVLRIGETAKLNLFIVPHNATKPNLKWTSSNDGIVAINENGEVTAHAVGTVNILVATDTHNFANCLVTVIDEPNVVMTASFLSFFVDSSDVIVVDWGDGSEQEIRSGSGHFYKDYTTNTALRTVKIYGSVTLLDYRATNGLVRLDVSNAPKLSALTVNDNLLISLDVSNNTELVRLEVSDNFLSSLDVSNNNKLIDLRCSNNKLSELNLGSIGLGRLFASENRLKNLDFSNNLNL